MKTIDFRSDTVTKPTQAMREQMAKAAVGDDVMEEDPTVQQLEELAARSVGKEKALFVPSGTMGNQIAVKLHTNPSDEIVLEAQSHIFYYEAGGVAGISSVQARQIEGDRGMIAKKQFQDAIRAEDIHFPKTSLLCLENTHNRAGGRVMPLQDMKELYDCAKEHQIAVHLDGARLFNAATALKVEAKEIAQYTDTVMFCLSKGLGAPVGSILAGDAKSIESARKIRKMLGGGMRQAGIIAAAGVEALTVMTKRLQEDHDHARKLHQGIKDVKGIRVSEELPQTNMVMVDIDWENEKFLNRLKKIGILAGAAGEGRIRFVTHFELNSKDIDEAIARIKNEFNNG